MILPKYILKYIGQGENSDLSVLVSEFDHKLDQFFGIDYQSSEEDVVLIDEQVYSNHLQEALLTSYLDYHQIFTDLKTGTILDLGAGYCRGTLLSEVGDYAVNCISVELIENRVKSAREYLVENKLSSQLINQVDILDKNFILPDVDSVYLYLPTGDILNVFLKLILEGHLENKTIYAVESHGDFIETLDFYHEFFEKRPSSLKTSIQRHDSAIYKYKIRPLEQVKKRYNQLAIRDITELSNLPLWLLKYSHVDFNILVQSKVPGQNEPHIWQANTKGCRYIKYNGEVGLQLKLPSRILQLETQDKIVTN